MGVNRPGLGFSSVFVSGRGDGPRGLAAGGGFGKGSARLGSTFSMAFGGVIGSTFAGVKGATGALGGGCASTTSVFVRILGGVMGAISAVAIGSGGGEGGVAMTTSVGMRSDRVVAMCSDPQRSDRLVNAVRCTRTEVRNAGARGGWLTVAPSAQT
jgi:hypothetical protein